MIINLFVITGILLQLEKDFNDRPDNTVERIILKTSENDGESMKALKEKSGRKSPFEFTQ